MPDEAYVPAHPGDILTAANWNQLQALIKQDIQQQIKDAVDKLTKTGVQRADNADRFDEKTPNDWTDDLDKRYAPISLTLEGVAGYRRYIKEFTPDLDRVLLHHKLGRFPLVDVCVLCGVPGANYQPPTPDPNHPNLSKDLSSKRLLVYYGDEEADDLDLLVRLYREQPEFLGVALPLMLDELKVRYDDRRTLADVINDMWEALFQDPNDEIQHDVSPWIRDAFNRGRTIGSLREGGEWDNLRVGMRVERIPVGGQPVTDVIMPKMAAGRQGAAAGNGQPGPTYSVNLYHVNYQTVLVQVAFTDVPQGAKVFVDLMMLMRSSSWLPDATGAFSVPRRRRSRRFGSPYWFLTRNQVAKSLPGVPFPEGGSPSAVWNVVGSAPWIWKFGVPSRGSGPGPPRMALPFNTTRQRTGSSRLANTGASPRAPVGLHVHTWSLSLGVTWPSGMTTWVKPLLGSLISSITMKVSVVAQCECMPSVNLTCSPLFSILVRFTRPSFGQLTHSTRGQAVALNSSFTCGAFSTEASTTCSPATDTRVQLTWADPSVDGVTITSVPGGWPGATRESVFPAPTTDAMRKRIRRSLRGCPRSSSSRTINGAGSGFPSTPRCQLPAT